jgi:hypothetical protein
VKQYRPSLLFLFETKMRDDKVKRSMWFLGYNGCIAVSSEGKSGGLALFWPSTCCVNLKNMCTNFLNVDVLEESGISWRATFVYGEPKTERRHVVWDRLCFLKSQWNGPWVCIGDFNEALSHDEHLGAREGCPDASFSGMLGGLPTNRFGLYRSQIHMEQQAGWGR